MTTRIGIAAPNAASADAALSVASQGGGAVDAAVAAMLTAMVNEPGIVSLTGGAFITIWPAGTHGAVTVDGCVAMPGLGRPADAPPPDVREVTTDYGGGLTMTVGHGSVATPGALAALDLAHHRFGAVPWRDVVAPAEAIARRGFPLGTAAGYYLNHTRDSVFAWDTETSAALKRGDGSWVEPGDTMVIDGLADTLARIAEQGARAMYDGDLAAAITADIASRGGLLSSADLSAYQPVVRETLASSAGDWQLRTNPPPAFGGAVLTTMLTLLGDRPQGEWTVDDVAHLISILRRVLGYRREHLDVATDRELRSTRTPGRARSPSARLRQHRTHLRRRLDRRCLRDHSIQRLRLRRDRAGHRPVAQQLPRRARAEQGASPAPGDRLASNMAPTVGRSSDGGVLAIGTPGADRITTALTQVLASFTNGHADLQHAIDRPRLHLHYLDDTVVSARIEAEENMPLPELDLPVRRHQPLSMYFGGVGAAHLARTGEITAAADPRRAGAVAVSPE